MNVTEKNILPKNLCYATRVHLFINGSFNFTLQQS